MSDYKVESTPWKGYDRIGDVTVNVHAMDHDAKSRSAGFTMHWADVGFDVEPIPVTCDISAGAGCGSTKIAFSVHRGEQWEHLTVDIREFVEPIMEFALERMAQDRINKGLCLNCGGKHEGECKDYSLPVPEDEPTSIDEQDDVEEVGGVEPYFQDEFDSEGDWNWDEDRVAAVERDTFRALLGIEQDSPMGHEEDPDWFPVKLTYDVHARVVAGIVQLCTQYDATVLFRHDGHQYPWTSFMTVMEKLGPKEEGDEIEVGAMGPEKDLAKAMVLQALLYDVELMDRGPRGPDSPFAPKFGDE